MLHRVGMLEYKILVKHLRIEMEEESNINFTCEVAPASVTATLKAKLSSEISTTPYAYSIPSPRELVKQTRFDTNTGR